MTTENLFYQIDIVILRDDTLDPRSFGDPDPERRISFGSLLDELVTTPRDLAGVPEDGTIQLDIQRTHEWELVIKVLVWGAKAFAGAAVAEVGKRFVGWLAHRLKGQPIGSQSVIGKGKGKITIVSDSATDTAVTKAVATLLTKSAELRQGVQITIEPKSSVSRA